MPTSRLLTSSCLAAVLLGPGVARAQSPQASDSQPKAPTVSLLGSSMNGVLAFPLSPQELPMGALGTWSVDAAASGLGLLQSARISGDRATALDLSNAQVFVQKTQGWWQFLIEAGAYSLPALGTPYVPFDASHALHDSFGLLPEALVKIGLAEDTYIELGKLPTLIGPESTFTFENMNIARGLLWNQEPAVSRGVQANTTLGTVALAASLNDGYYSNRYNWVSASAAWTIDHASMLTFEAAANVGHTAYQATPSVTPVAQNNSAIYNLIYTYNSTPFIITPYLQFSHVPRNARLNIAEDTNSYSAALLVSYEVSHRFSLAARAEYIATDGRANLLYGPGSKAASFTLTPAYVIKRYYLRGEVSWVRAAGIAAGQGFGTDGNSRNQVRGLLEAGVLF